MTHFKMHMSLIYAEREDGARGWPVPRPMHGIRHTAETDWHHAECLCKRCKEARWAEAEGAKIRARNDL